MNAQPGRLVLLGHPLGHSLSPRIQAAALAAAGITRLSYEPLDVPPSRLDDVIDLLRRDRAAGNVTVPYKERFATACDRHTDVAAAVGAVNTFWTAVDGALVGDNTDVAGFEAAIQSLLGGAPGTGQRVAILGAGGGAAAVLRAIEGWQGARARLYGRTMSRAEGLLQRFRVAGEVVRSPADAVRDATLVVNATPVGLRDGDVPVEVKDLPPEAVVFDLAYRTGGTNLVRAARAAGHRAADGIGMLVEQAALAFERWFGSAPPREAMWRAVAPQ